jgi:valyl-tRNA synthetase
MVFTLQTIRSIVAVVLFAVSSQLCAAALSACAQGDIKVSAKTVGKAILWLQNCQQPWQQQNLRLQFTYSASIPAWAFKKAANVILARNVSDQVWKQHKKTFANITQLYQPIQAGDVYQLDYDAANKALSLSLNSQLKGSIQGDVAQQYFLIWFGEKPFSVDLKQQLLR